MGAWDKGSTRAWRRIRAAILEANQRDNDGRCTLAIPGVCTGTADCVHHTQGRAITGDDPKHMVAACRACNQHIGKPGQHAQPKKLSKW
ncbi:hypothetical protein [Amycolatopsis sp. NPDC051128]|uniref:hypothetical protein n=1 Tax=Amycolatopsis sp. NPDC051128 TaxID=3155412 RepID=UPI00341B4242